MKAKASLFVILAGILWGSMGLFVRGLSAYGMSSISITSVRLLTGALFMLIGVAIYDRSLLRFPLKMLSLYLVTALFSVLAMSTLYFIAINLTSLAVAAILLYTAPAFVMLLSAIFFKEKITMPKFIALILAVGGCVLVGGWGGSVSLTGLLCGLGSGLAYALYSIFGVVILQRVHPFTSTPYVFLFAGIGSLFLENPVTGWSIFLGSGIKCLLLGIFMGLLTAAIPYILYTCGLKFVEPGKAAILATLEPMVASLCGIVLLHESLTFAKVAGILAILAACILLNLADTLSQKKN